MLVRKKEKNKRGVTKEEVNFSERQNSEDLRILFREFLADRKVEGKARAERIDEMHRGWTLRTNFSIKSKITRQLWSLSQLNSKIEQFYI